MKIRNLARDWISITALLFTFVTLYSINVSGKICWAEQSVFILVLETILIAFGIYLVIASLVDELEEIQEK